MKTNDLIFKELLTRGFTLENKTRVWNIADSKLWYLTPSQAQGFLNLEKNEGYKKSIIAKEISLINNYLSSFLKELPFKTYNLIDLGCGDGKKASLFIKEFSKHLSIRYCPIDISAYMVNQAARTIKKLKVGEVLKFKWNISDFENLDNVMPLFRDAGFEHHFMMLLGNTLGNFDRDDILHGIKNSMAKNDVLLIGNGISNGRKSGEWIKDYKNEKINKWLIKVPLLLGLKESDIKYEVRFVNSRIEEIYILQKDISLKHLGKTVKFEKGDIIIVAISYKYTKDKFKQNIKKFFPKVKIYTDKDKSYTLAFCKK
ncbi:MAG: hypothetical protein A3H59_01825 [Candidatus Jacksonbacteria bacterium RIFCSPLOWO2_02_FULL_43_9]|nr:MAG: hypothetical protein UV70_C0005G0008 [Parcubacteria group bacterium GW2011_GWA2_43_13]OGY69887.1 MAG: hypothetical protein A3B94_02710 [Candidatus Jacksonbacteria bacterium RIFCSPHIGHO2_02_FULL_43_10]OGY71270.1 MAG: hypothetical protein A2986_04130 [Candidatus Jacksonbacteria bacterium RIFCSPLOWO2_01_FULL_44_13]OGY73360.1 MAG: hypothetical protein A3H59_01825 [Candidatus Jacksonbacteria bacterium RIFCSPLOWO2_02_FULL_43_9]HAZ17136.1 hypothetical protein [Candidatus Jacksonbacteria bacter